MCRGARAVWLLQEQQQQAMHRQGISKAKEEGAEKEAQQQWQCSRGRCGGGCQASRGEDGSSNDMCCVSNSTQGMGMEVVAKA